MRQQGLLVLEALKQKRWGQIKRTVQPANRKAHSVQRNNNRQVSFAKGAGIAAYANCLAEDSDKLPAERNSGAFTTNIRLMS
jgi:hypothetical protein